MNKVIGAVKRTATGFLFGAVAFALAAGAAFAQVPSTNPPYNIDLGLGPSNTSTPQITLSAQAPATVNSAQLSNLDKNGAMCTLVITSESGSPTAAFSIQNYDAASQTYYTVVTNTPTPVPGTDYSIFVHPGAQTASLPTAVVAGTGIPLSRFWRVQVVLAGAGTTATGTVGCNLVK